MNLFSLLLPELLVTAAALVLFLLGVVKGPAGRKVAPWIALGGLIVGGIVAFLQLGGGNESDFTGAIVAGDFSGYVKLITAGVGIILLLLCWPTNDDATGNRGLWFGHDAGEFFGLLLLSLVGIMLVAGANDTILLFMGIELASIPTYVLVVMGRPVPAAQEAGLKYFYLGAMSAAVMLLGFAYLYGATGTTNLSEISASFAGTLPLNDIFSAGTWRTVAIVLLLLGFAFKLAAVPLHLYAGDVYTGAATPVTALLSFVPKTTGIVATVKVLLAVSGGVTGELVGGEVWKTLFFVSILTMTVGNAMALLTENLKRVMAYSSIAHSGYMLAALTVLAAAYPLAGDGYIARDATLLAVSGVLFYLAAYGVMNSGVFGVLMMLPTRKVFIDADGNRRRLPTATAETYADLRGIGRRHPFLTAAMAVCCISLIGIPLTVGFLGKFFVIRPALQLAEAGGVTATWMYWLIGLTVLNAAVAAAYYLRIVSEMILLRSVEEEDADVEGIAYEPPPAPRQPWPIVTATALSVIGIFLFGMFPFGIRILDNSADRAARAVPLATVPTRVVPDQARSLMPVLRQIEAEQLPTGGE